MSMPDMFRGAFEGLGRKNSLSMLEAIDEV